MDPPNNEQKDMNTKAEESTQEYHPRPGDRTLETVMESAEPGTAEPVAAEPMVVAHQEDTERANPPEVAQEEDNEGAAQPAAPLPHKFVLGAFETTLAEAEKFETYKHDHGGTEGTWRRRLSTMAYRQVPTKIQKPCWAYMSMFTEANMLVVDPWSIRTIMAVRLFVILDDGCLHQISYSSSYGTVSDLRKVVNLYPSRRDRSLPPSLQFIHSTCAVVCDGGRVLTLYETDVDRTTWDPFFEYRIVGPQDQAMPGCDKPTKEFDFGFTIVDARLTMAKQQIDVCVRGVRDDDENFVRWITIWMPDTNSHNWVLKRHKSIVCPGDINFLGFDRNCDNLIFITSKTRQMPSVESDEKEPIKANDPSLVQVIKERDEASGDKILYVWYQTDEEVKVCLRLEQEDSHLFEKEDISFVASETHLTIKAKGQVVLDGELGRSIEAGSAQWNLPKPKEGQRRLEFSFKKKKGESPRGTMGGMLWLEMVKEDGRGKFIDNPADLEWSMQALDIEFVDNEMDITYRAVSKHEKEEECDIDEKMRFMWYLDETTNHISRCCDLYGNTLLFGTKAFPPLCQTRAICIKEGEHGYVYNFEIFPPRHIQILKAMAHSMAIREKTTRYRGVSPHGGYAVVVNCSESATVFWQTNLPTHGVINQYREVASRVYDANDQMCPMQTVYMRADKNDEEVDENILGYVATEDSLILLSSDTLVIHRLRVPPVAWAQSAAELNLGTR